MGVLQTLSIDVWIRRGPLPHSAHAHLSGNGHRSEKRQELTKWLKRKEYNRYVRVS